MILNICIKTIIFYCLLVMLCFMGKSDRSLDIALSILLANIPWIIWVFLPWCVNNDWFFWFIFVLLSWWLWILIMYRIFRNKKIPTNKINYFWSTIMLFIIWVLTFVFMWVSWSRNSWRTDDLNILFVKNLDFTPNFCEKWK